MKSVLYRLQSARTNLLVVVGFSAVNAILSLLNVDVYFLFSATFPMSAIDYGRAFAEVYENNALFVAGTIIALAAIALYGVCYMLSKKLEVFILVALIMFSVDTLYLVWELFFLYFDISMLIDLAFHGLVLYYLIVGVKAWMDLKKQSQVNDWNR